MEHKNKSLILLRGLPGSGKTTLAKILGGKHFETDTYFMISIDPRTKHIIHHSENAILGEQISQKEALEYFDCEELLPDIKEKDSSYNHLRMRLGTEIRKYTRKYGSEAVVSVLTSIIEDYFPS